MQFTIPYGLLPVLVQHCMLFLKIVFFWNNFFDYLALQTFYELQ